VVVPALQVQSPEFKPQSHKKRKKKSFQGTNISWSDKTGTLKRSL
jgi:hypothetical protein